MTEQDAKSLARAWLDYHHLPRREAEARNLFSAWEELNALVCDQPEAAWQIIERLWSLDQTDRMLALIAAGPLEDLLCRHGADFIERIEQLAVQDSVIRKMLGAVWGQNRMAEDVWQRLKAVAGPSF